MQNRIRGASDHTTDASTTTSTLNIPSVAAQIGPRKPGVVYDNTDGAFRVLDVITNPSEARRILKRRSAQFAVIVIDTLRPGAEPFAVGSVWTGSDRVLKAVA